MQGRRLIALTELRRLTEIENYLPHGFRMLLCMPSPSTSRPGVL